MIKLILLLLIAMFIMIAVISLVYFIIYKVLINRRIVSGETNKRKMISPFWMTIILFAIVFVIYLIVSVILSRVAYESNDQDTIPDEYFYATYDYNVYYPDEMNTGYLSNFSIEENPGYEKYEEVMGDIKFTYFISCEEFDTYHPAFIIYAEYTGDKEGTFSTDYMGKFLTQEGIEICGTGAGGGDYEEYICVVGNTSIDCSFSFDLHFYEEGADKEAIEANIDEVSFAHGTVVLDLKRE